MRLIFLLVILFTISCQEKEYTTETLIVAHQKASGANLLGTSIKTLSLEETTSYEDSSGFTVYKKFEFPNKLKVNQVYAGFTQDFIINGEEGLSVQNQIQGTKITPEQMPSFKEQTHLMQFYRWEERGWSYEYTGKEKLGVLEYYILEGSHSVLQLNNKVFLHPKTFLISKIILRSPQYNATAEFSDYFKNNGLQYPMKYTIESNNVITTTQTSNFIINPSFSANTFDINFEVQ